MSPVSVEILLVEDDPNDLELAIRALKEANVANNVQVARNGAEAIACLRDENRAPRVVLLDLKLPKVNGLQVLEWIRQNARTRHLPVVVLTSSREEPDVARCYDLGVNSYIVKPVEFDAFARVVRDLGFYWMLLNEPPR